MGRFKFTSDQLWNKVLLNTIYPWNQTDMPKEEAGPPAESAGARGVATERRREEKAESYPIRHGLNYLRPRVLVEGLDTGTEVGGRKIRNIGKERFETRLVSTAAWFVHLQAFLREEIFDKLRWTMTSVASNSRILDKRITQFANNEKVDQPPHKFE
jgi:hypothetical protein